MQKSAKVQNIKKKSKKKNTFVLKGINSTEIDKKYGISLATNLEQKDYVPSNATTIDELHSCNKQSFFFSFIDDSRRHCITMIDSITKQSIQSTCCFWCRHSFTAIPIGCPIRYTSNKIIQLHTSEITKEKYIINQKITNKIYENENNNKKSNDKKLIYNNYYETDGSFCSFNCCLAFINDNTYDTIYINSSHLLMKMYIDIFGSDKLFKISPAPSWRLLRVYGGFMTIQEFRDSYTNYVYIDNNHQISRLPKVMPVGHIFEEHIIF